MKELELLLNQRWVLKSENKELYYQLRDAIGDIRKYASDKLGCQVTENALMVKMEKIPVIPETFMGIQDFSSKEEYAFFCILLMFLEEKIRRNNLFYRSLPSIFLQICRESRSTGPYIRAGED